MGREYSRRDDIESWFYVMVEIYKGALPWGKINDMNLVGRLFVDWCFKRQSFRLDWRAEAEKIEEATNGYTEASNQGPA